MARNGRATTLGQKFVEWLQRESMVRAGSLALLCLPACGAAGAARLWFDIQMRLPQVFFMGQTKMAELSNLLQFGGEVWYAQCSPLCSLVTPGLCGSVASSTV